MIHAAGDRSAPPRTPLRNISNACGPSPGRPNNFSVMMHKSVLALRAGAAPGGSCAVAMQQVSGKQVYLATSPMQISRVGAMMRSPMAGRTPEDMKRAAKRMQAHVPVSLSPFRPSGLQQHRPQPVFDNQFIQRLPFVASSMLSAVDAYAGAALQPPTAPTVVDLGAEQARIKKAEAKAKREAKAALKAEQEALRREHEQRAAEEHAAILAQQNAAVLDAIANVDAEDCCDLELIEPLDTMPWQLVAIGQSLRVLVDKKVSLHPMSLQQIQDALRARKPTLETENMLAALHSPLLEAARGNNQSASKMSSTSSWMTQVKKWAHEELGSHSPFHGNSVPGNKKEGTLDYKRLTYLSRLSLLHDLCCAAMARIINTQSGGGDVADQECASALQQTPLGQDSQGRRYWLGVDISGTPSAWVLRERSSAREAGRSRYSVLSSEGTPLKDRCLYTGSPVGGGVVDAEGQGGQTEEGYDKQDPAAPERGEAGDNFYWHQHWVAVMSRASRPNFYEAEDEVPQMDLLTSDAQMVRSLTKALWKGESECEVKLARVLVAKVLTPLVQEPVTTIKGALRKQPTRSSRAAANVSSALLSV